MDLAVLKNYAQKARKDLQSQINIRLGIVLQKGSLEEREQPEAIHKLKEAISESSREKVIERTAYTWFNRFVALRYIDAKQYGEIRVLSPAEGETVPEILSSAKQGFFSSGIRLDAQKKSRIQSLLNGSLSSTDPESEAYRMLLSSVCNAWSQKMPFLFEKISDYTELLLPTDLLSIDSIRARTVEALTEEKCETVEVIGWLYQYYISEKKDEVFALLKKGKKISPEDIPSATQLFTPNWIVKYMVQNTLGRIWMKSHPRSKLTSIMEYYIPDSENSESVESKLPKELNRDNLFVSQKTEHPEIPTRVEELRFCDPACGSGHILVYAFELFYAIYIEEGYIDSEIPELILKNNLFGIEIDNRAGELASLALSLKAREKHRDYFQSPTKPNILIFENIHLEKAEIQSYQDFLGEKALSKEILSLFGEFKEAKHFGSLIRPSTTNVKSLRESLETLEISDLYILKTHEYVLQALRQAEYLHPSYHIVVANPPYMGGKGMNDGMKKFLGKQYEDVKSDLFSAFIVRCMELIQQNGQAGFMSPFVWMFLSTFEDLRNYLLKNYCITSLVKPSYTAFFDSAIVAICTFTVQKSHYPQFKGAYFDLEYLGTAEEQSPRLLQRLKTNQFYRVSASDFQKIPGSPIAFWVSDRIRDVFKSTSLEQIGSFKRGIATGDNNYFLRFWFETNLHATSIITNNSKWKKYNKGGEYRKYYGNQDYVINWYNDGFEVKNFLDDKGKLRSRPQNIEYNFQNSISYSSISSGTPSLRYYSGFINDQSGNFINLEWNKLLILIGLLNSKIILSILNLLNPTLNLLTSDFDKLPIKLDTNTIYNNDLLINLSKLDWDSYETSWDFTGLPLLRSTEVWDLKKLFPEESLFGDDSEEIPLLSPSFPDSNFPKPLDIETTYHKLNNFWKEMISETKQLEEENNRIFIEAYGLQEELTPEVPIHEITLTCNPYYRYDKDKSSSELERLLLQDTMKEFISYSVGCMFGRYSPDKEGLILANQGESLEDYLQKIGKTKESALYLPDEDNVIPILDEDWFSDDITGRFREFLEKTFGKENFQKNLNFIESALGTLERPKKIRDYFLKDFTNDHIKRYKKRPIYWLFQSPKGSFQALIYMHRYRTETVGTLLSNYVREYINKLEFKITSLTEVQNSKTASTSEKSRALRELPKLKLSLEELKLYEKELYEIASKRLAIDLDDGVKVNYLKFGKILKTITGLDAKEED